MSKNKSSTMMSSNHSQPSAEEPNQEMENSAAARAVVSNENEPSTSQGQVRNQVKSEGSAESSKQQQLQLNGPVMRIKRELSEITENPPPNCTAEMYKEDLFHWRAMINGPIGTVYEDGVFKLDIRFPAAYPFRPPQIRFVTRIYHCNVDSRGVICLDVLNERWSPVMNIAKVLLSIWVLIGECNPNDPLVMGIAEQYKGNRNEHDKIARYWTKRFAMPKVKSKDELDREEKEEQTPPSSGTEESQSNLD